jgi:(2R)-3-sulfolactate dehydrogenase (NADP+)
MLPMGDAKGTALAFMVEMLAAGLTGAQFAFEASSYLDAEGAPSQTGQLILALSPEALGGANATAHMARLAREVAQEPGARLPGARRLALRKEAADSGLSLDERLIADMIALAQAATGA